MLSASYREDDRGIPCQVSQAGRVGLDQHIHRVGKGRRPEGQQREGDKQPMRSADLRQKINPAIALYTAATATSSAIP